MQKELKAHCPKCQHDFISVVELEESVAVIDNAKLAEIEAPLQEKITGLEEQVATLQSPEARAQWVKEWLTDDRFVETAIRLGYKLPEVPEADVEEDNENDDTELEKKELEVKEPEDKVEPDPDPIPVKEHIKGKTDLPGYQYYPNLDISVKKE